MTDSKTNGGRIMAIKGTRLKVINVGEADTFEGDKGEKVAKQPLTVEIHGPITVMAYGRNVDKVKDLDLNEGDEVTFTFNKLPGVRL
jgi:hypothetical protein